ncbi:hypothetical protein FIBSPDRAFT_866883 [Athelia psychrophila]|uniref:Uncharacterized protein n=1 Tax=Athelia psychrophila TaxID=1759441 RepID=A0A166EFL8_9AGAM|nr:hypothetical protein FIBSPDRAFT_866883 [Fibularhizoctonia sp. CBS 109695]
MECARKLTQGKETPVDMQGNPYSSQARTTLDRSELCSRPTALQEGAGRRVQNSEKSALGGGFVWGRVAHIPARYKKEGGAAERGERSATHM